MVMWTIVPDTILFEDKSCVEMKSQTEQREFEFHDKKIITRRIDEEHYEIVRLISSNPDDYLNEAIQPGKIMDNNFS